VILHRSNGKWKISARYRTKNPTQDPPPSILSSSDINSSPEKLLFEEPHDDVRRSAKGKRQLEAHVTAKLGTAFSTDWTSPPDLCHAQNSTHNAETEGDQSSNTWW
jgi:hypothetical protein